MTLFWVIMLKRADGKVYADLHKSLKGIYGTREEAQSDLNYMNENCDNQFENYHVVPLIAQTPEECEVDISDYE